MVSRIQKMTTFGRAMVWRSNGMKQDRIAEKTFFDKFPYHYEVLTSGGYERILAEFAKLIHPRRGERLLELGCGSGALTKRLARWPLELTGIDISIKNILEARNDIAEGRFITGDIEKIPFKDNTFDIIVYGGVLHHFPNMTGVIEEGLRILKPGGYFFSYDPHQGNPFMWLYRDKKSPFRSTRGITSNEILINKKSLRRCLEGAGLRRVLVTAISGVSYKFVAGLLARKLLPFYNLVDKAIDRSFLKQRYGAFIVAGGQKGA